MASALIESTDAETLADLVRRLGSVPLERILMKPAPGTATEKDLLAALEAPRKRICELVEGVLVEKSLGTLEAILAGVIVQLFWNFVEPRDLGVVIPADGPLRLWLGLVRIPDVSFVSWSRIPGDEFPDHPVARVIPDLAVEVLSKGNAKGEMERKLREYFEAGVRIVWLIDPKTRTARIYTAPTKFRTLREHQSLDGENILPGFVLPLKELFARGKPKRRKS